MAEPGAPRGRQLDNVEEIIETVEDAGERPDRVSVFDVVDEIGHDAFPVILLVPALVLVSPASGIPGMSTTCAVIIVLTAGQALVGRRSVWLPGFIGRRTVSRQRLDKVMGWMQGPAHLIDRLTRRRLSFPHRPPFRHRPDHPVPGGRLHHPAARAGALLGNGRRRGGGMLRARAGGRRRSLGPDGNGGDGGRRLPGLVDRVSARGARQAGTVSGRY